MAQATFFWHREPAAVSAGELPADIAEVETQLTTLMLAARAAKTPVPGQPGRLLERSGYQLLTSLLDNGPARGSDLAIELGLDLSTVSRQVSALCELNLVDRTADPNDGRATRLSLTEEGAVVVTATRRYRRDTLHAHLRGWSASDREEFGRLLAKFNSEWRPLVAADATPSHATHPAHSTHSTHSSGPVATPVTEQSANEQPVPDPRLHAAQTSGADRTTGVTR